MESTLVSTVLTGIGIALIAISVIVWILRATRGFFVDIYDVILHYQKYRKSDGLSAEELDDLFSRIIKSFDNLSERLKRFSIPKYGQ